MSDPKKFQQSDFSKSEHYGPRNAKERLLIKAILSLENEEEAANFLRDLLTISEIEEFSNRIEIARLLMEGLSYQKIAEQTGTSTTTVTRVAYWLLRGCEGYWKVLNRLFKK